MTEQIPAQEAQGAALLADQVHALSESMTGVSKPGRAFLDGAETALRAVAAEG